MWYGGSLAFWERILHPEKIVGVDLTAREDSGYFRDYVQGRGSGIKSCGLTGAPIRRTNGRYCALWSRSSGVRWTW